MKKVAIGVREFALPIPRTGSIEVNSGYGALPMNGQEIHEAVQAKRELQHGNYRSEVRISQSFEQGDYKFVLTGQIDGIFDGPLPVIEEIKSSFDIQDLYNKLQNDFNHPYCMQLKTYVYMLGKQTSSPVSGRMHLVSARSLDFLNLEIPFDETEYENWLALRLVELEAAQKVKEEDERRRSMISRTLVFPFESPRAKQLELIESIEQHLTKGGPLLIQAPTGLGKTVGVMYPVVKEAFGRGQKLVYVTPKNSQHSVAEDAVKKFQKKTRSVRSLTLTAKAKLCLKEEQVCNPEYCEFARDYYKKVHELDLVNKLTKHQRLDARKFREYGEQYEVCPFELSLDSLDRADVVIADYNYVFSPRSLIGRLTAPNATKSTKPNLVIDEAHNLHSRAADYYSAVLSTAQLEELKRRISEELPEPWSTRSSNLIDRCCALIRSYAPAGGKRESKVALDPEMFEILNSELQEHLSLYLKASLAIEQQDAVLKMCSLWADFTSAMMFDGDNFFTTVRVNNFGTLLKVTCCDASEKLKAAHDSFAHVVAFSATLKPFDYYSQLSGMSNDKTKTIEFESPFPKENRKLLVIPQVSTKYAERRHYAPRIAAAIEKIAQQRRGNYFVFFPSFEFLADVFAMVNLPDFDVVRQQAEMRTPEVNGLIDKLKSQSAPTLVFAVQGGVFSEGVDYPGDSVIGAIIVGPGLPNYNIERELLREYYEKRYGSGFDYAYTFPAMTKVIQSAGRVIRSENERGLIVLMDKRFTHDSYVNAMPNDWFEESVNELISTKILTDIDEFWRGTKLERTESCPV